MSPAELATALKAQARAAGACLAGIAPVDPPAETGYFQNWLSAGRHGDMTYLAKNAQIREDLRRWDPKAKSVLVCAFSYAGPDEEEGPVPPPLSPSAAARRSSPDEGLCGAARPPYQEAHGRIARYAVLPDYHDILRARMKKVRDWLRGAQADADGVVFIDTSPILEKRFARYAGIGWMGKNTLLIHPEAGSYFFIAGLSLNIELPADEPVPDHCGTCRRCIEACPTDAFPSDYKLDASRCVAYFTIEHRGAVPPEFREGVGSWVFGCDVCQEVCPWNKFAVRPAVPEFNEPSMPLRIPLREWSRLTPTETKPYRHTPIQHTRWRGWMRNVLLAMGNSGDASLERELSAWAQDKDPVLAEQARWSLERLRLASSEAARP